MESDHLNFEEKPIEISRDLKFEPFELNYTTFEGELRPHIAIYYQFPNHWPFGVCHEYKVDLENYLLRKMHRVYPVNNYIFERENCFLKILNNEKKQGIRTQALSGLSFTDLSKVVAEIHSERFFKKHDWMKSLNF